MRRCITGCQRDLLGEEVGPVSDLWVLPPVTRILRRQ
jgi:hypothetical protein